ncbi:MAG TPA: PAS domain S-box protein, partial [Candidatus Dormibacteraeota bacterium]
MSVASVQRPIQVLLVEDNPGDARLIFEMLKEVESELFTLERVDRLEAALERLGRAAVDVVLLDLGLPDSTGIATFERAHDEAPGQPIVVISGLDDERIALEAVRSGAQDYLVKGRIEGQLLVRVLRYAIERKRSEETLRASEAHYRAILEHIGDAVFVTDSEGRFIDVNPRACELMGYTRDELLRLTSADTYPLAIREQARGRLRNIAAGNVRFFERQLLRKDGSLCTVEVSARPLPDGKLLATLRDVTERRRNEAALRESEERFRQLAESIREAFFVVDILERRTVYVSPTWAEIWGRPLRDAYDRPDIWIDSVHPDDRPRLLAGQEQLARGAPNIDTFRVVRPDGSVRWVRGRAFPIRNAAGQVYRIAGVSEDITELKLAEQQLLQAQRMEAVGRLAGGVAHDFNNLLTVISSYSQLVASDLAPDDPRRTDLDEVMKAATAAAGLTRQLLAFSRGQVLEPKVLDLNNVVDAAGKMLKRLIGEDIDLATRLADDIAAIKADEGQMEQVVMNLVVNARDAMPEGGKVTIETQNVDVDATYTQLGRTMPAGAYVMLAVSDTGSGISEEVREHIFEPFFTTKGPGKGTGLGLATVYGIVKQSGGYIACYSEPGHGTTFKIYFPPVEDVSSAAALGTAVTSLRGDETVLIAEDATP